MNKLLIPNYVGESYYYQTISCVDAPIAIASGYFNYDNYFLYCAYYSLFAIWGDNEIFPRKSNRILEKIGLELSAKSIGTRDSFFHEIEVALNKGFPVYISLDYFYMFYCDFSYQKRHGKHGIIVCGIDEQTSTVTIMDCAHISFDNPFQCLTLTQDILWDLWKKSDCYFAENYKVYGKIFWLTQKKSNVIVNNDYSFLKDFVESKYISENDALINKMILNNNIDLYDSGLFKRDLVDSVKSVFNLIDNVFNKIDRNIEWYKNYNELKQRYLHKRSQIVSIFLKGLYKGKKLEKSEEAKYIDDIQMINAELKVFFEKFYTDVLSKENSSVCDCINDIDLIDFAPNAIVTASSELEAYNTVFSAERVINGKFDGFVTDMWASNDEPSPHWIMVDIGREISIYKVTIIHDFRSPDLYLSDYIIQGSNDKACWVDLESVVGNNKSRTTHYCFGQKYKYFRIYITKPSKLDNTARIFGIECWGIE